MDNISVISREQFLKGLLATTAMGTLGLTSAREAQATPVRQMGAKVDGYPGSTEADGADALRAWRNKTGFLPQSVLFFNKFGEYTIPARHFIAAQSLGVVPMVTLEPQANTLASIINGSHDAWIDEFAQTVASTGRVVRVRFAHEMNGGWYPWGRQPSAYISAFRRVSSRIRSRASNAHMVFAPNVGQDNLKNYYPGSAYVQWLALDGYDFRYGEDTPNEVFAASYSLLASLDSRKPIMIAETATGAGDHKPGWIRKLFLGAIPNSMPRIRNVVWFDMNKEQDWRVNSSAAALSTYKSVEATTGWSGAS